MKKQIKAREERNVKYDKPTAFISLLQFVSGVVRLVPGVSFQEWLATRINYPERSIANSPFFLDLLHQPNHHLLLSLNISSIDRILQMRKL